MLTRLKYLAAAMALPLLLGGHAAAQPVEITMWSGSGNLGLEAQLAAFSAANPDIKVNSVTFGSEELKTQLRVTVAGGNIPDIYATNGGFTFFEYVDRGAAMDITDLVKERGWDKRTEAAFLAANTDPNGRIFGMPWNFLTYQALFYDKEFFEQNKIPLPASIADVKDVVEKIKAAGRFPIAFGDKDGWPAILMLGDLMLQETTPGEIDKLNSGEHKWTDFAPAADAFNAIATLAADGAFMPGFLTSNHEIAIMTWVGKKSAMLYNGTWWPSVAKTDDPFPLAIADFPMIDPNGALQGAQSWPGQQLLMSSQLEGAKKEAAIKLYDFLISDEGMTLYGNARKAFTTNPNSNQKITEIAAFYKEPAIARQAGVPKMQFFDHAFPIPVVEALKVELQKVMQNNGYTAAQALAAVEAVHAAERAKS